MFTGIVEEIGTIRAIGGGRLQIAAARVLEGTKLVDSIAVNGICLTVTAQDAHGFQADVMPETIRRTSLEGLHAGSRVNLERALSLGDRLGGHIVSGHIDGTGVIRSIVEEKNARVVHIEAPAGLLRYIIEKGSVALDGVSLTVAGVTEQEFSVSLIPHTRQETTLHEKKAGDLVNIENDLLGKYVEKLLGLNQAAPVAAPHEQLTREWLAKYGF